MASAKESLECRVVRDYYDGRLTAREAVDKLERLDHYGDKDDRKVNSHKKGRSLSLASRS